MILTYHLHMVVQLVMPSIHLIRQIQSRQVISMTDWPQYLLLRLNVPYLRVDRRLYQPFIKEIASQESQLMPSQPLQWKTIPPRNHSPRPSIRWGHSSCTVEGQMYIFGGFANNAYMNDLWCYHLEQQRWEEITTYGDVPEKRSNSTLNYDSVNHQLLLFGGGSPAKQRHNSVHTLDLNTHNWVEITPCQNEAAPWERTYHIAQFQYPFLVVFGGQAADDLGDLWVYDVRTLTWQEVKTDGDTPCSRRFHASCLVGSRMYIFGGCYGKYICLNDLYSIDLSPLFEQSSQTTLHWEQHTPSQPLTQRWGHTLSCYDNQLFIFGGRSHQDLNQLVSLSLDTFQVSLLQVINKPAARRRHSGGFIGSCLVLFGGFDGNYFDDLVYINLYQNRKGQIHNITDIAQLVVKAPKEYVLDQKGNHFYFYSALLGKYFKQEENLFKFLWSLQNKYSSQDLSIIFQTFYRGWGPLPLFKTHQSLLSFIPDSQYQSLTELVHTFMETPYFTLVRDQRQQFCVQLEQNKFDAYVQLVENHWQMNCTLTYNNQPFKVSYELLSLYSHYFNILLSHNSQSINMTLPYDSFAFKLVILYLHTNILVTPKPSSHLLYEQIARIAQYLSLNRLLHLCEEQLCKQISQDNYQEFMQFAESTQMEKLQQMGALFMVKDYFQTTSNHKENTSKLSHKTRELYQTLKFDLLHHSQEKAPFKYSNGETPTKNKETGQKYIRKKSSSQI